VRSLKVYKFFFVKRKILVILRALLKTGKTHNNFLSGEGVDKRFSVWGSLGYFP